ncbi:MAG: hypothetical protein IPK16_13855 [Anaerolineales bacterium]|nr:hypothetical protein [Anaerolineales bacterium]
MAVDPSFDKLNRESTARIRALGRLTDDELQRKVGEHWTVAIALVHLAFWDWRVLDLLDRTEQAGELVAPEIDVVVNDLSLPIWAAVPPRDAVRFAVEAAEVVDQRLAAFAPALLEEMNGRYVRWVVRALHRNEHLDEIDAALAR